MNSKKNAFTLIELLAIIVILAIIAVITVPIILNIIDNSRRGAAKDSAYGYKDSINKWYVSKLSEDPNYNIPDGEYKVGQLGEQVEGKVPGENSWYKVTKNEVTDACLQFDEYKVEIKEGKVGDAVKGECSSNNSAYVPLTGEVLENIQSYFSNDIDRVVYYNPIDGKTCTDYVSNNSIPGYKGVVPETNDLGQTKCLKWYKYSTNKDGSINMILDHNTETRKEYYAAENYNTYGPADLMQYLTLTEWAGVPTRSDKYTAYVDNGTTKTVKFTNATDNTVNYSEKKARLITAQEIAEITGNTGWNEQSTSSRWFYLDSKTTSQTKNSSNPSEYYWLFENLKDCQQYGCINQYQDIAIGNYGYWTSSPGAGSSRTAWRVYSDGYLNNSYVDGNDFGVRPVITVSNS